MGEFRITGPGEFVTRDGRKVVVTHREHGAAWPWVGHEPSDELRMTFEDSGAYSCKKKADKFDIIGPWVEPAVSADTELADPGADDSEPNYGGSAGLGWAAVMLDPPVDTSVPALSAALRNLIASLGPVVSPATGDAITLANLALEIHGSPER